MPEVRDCLNRVIDHIERMDELNRTTKVIWEEVDAHDDGNCLIHAIGGRLFQMPDGTKVHVVEMASSKATTHRARQTNVEMECLRAALPMVDTTPVPAPSASASAPAPASSASVSAPSALAPVPPASASLTVPPLLSTRGAVSLGAYFWDSAQCHLYLTKSEVSFTSVQR